ncbi:PREDICTED: uncharacterized protein LOC107162740 [Diuraphis noxia]|uniref:uncharacterized protein LOC107162740 n=1 Tax=Diuraphis noxia TaxID=143948 RepID=UPI00076376DB|nr:PREDICTED: uncharacterized protein LOC107162740 [Diuraphis noxia]
MNSFVKYDHGPSASKFFEHTRRTDADFRRKIYDLKIAMYKTTYKKSFYWPEHIPKSNVHQVEPEFTMIPKLNEDQYKQLYTPRILKHRNLSENKRIVPPLEYSNSAPPKCQDEDLNYSDTHARSLYQESYINWTPSQAHKKEETPEEWVQKWRNECHNVRDADDLVQDLSNRIIKSQRMILNRKKIGYA